MRRSALVTAVCLAGAVLAGCSSGDSNNASSSTTVVTKSSSGAANQDSGSSAAASIPDSKSIDDLTKDLTNIKAADLVAKCNVLATVMLGKDVGMNNDPEVKDSLAALVNVVRPLDPAVADALAADPKSAAGWCKAKGMTN